MTLSSVEQLMSDLTLGKMIILMDDENRENEGDLVMAASKITDKDINFMTRFARGLLCMPITQARCEYLQLPLMVKNNTSKYHTNFTVSIEAAKGVSTGISCADRAKTIRTASNPQTTPHDLVQPGHIFPLMVVEGGVLSRPGHTEAASDLVRLAGLGDCAVLIEILNEDGTMARRPQLEIFAKQHGLKMGTIAELVHYRSTHEATA